MDTKKIESILDRLERWLRLQEYKGYDPYDGLNSPILSAFTFGNRMLGRLTLQAMKLSPLNFRKLLMTNRGYNPKGLGLIISAYLTRYKLSGRQEDLARAKELAGLVILNRSKGYLDYCWGYNFAWPGRSFYAKKGTPNMVTTAFISHALLDMYEATGEVIYLDITNSACNFMLNDLNRTEDSTGRCFSYTPLDNSRIHNANLLGASVLARTFSITRDKRLKQEALLSLAYSINFQAKDGSWLYGQADNQKWIDSFHTAYNLLALDICNKCLGDEIYEQSLIKGYRFYLFSFFLPQGIVKYYNNRTYPLDSHAFSCALITLTQLQGLDSRSRMLRDRVFDKAITLFQDKEKGYFYYRKYRFYTNRIAYIRWVQAWMFLALAKISSDEKENCLV